jgi:MFS superfamily sulfate permease-like transporter
VTVSEDIRSIFYAPDFDKLWTQEFWGAVISICLVGSLETLLSATAVDKLDPYKRESNLNRDLTAVGIGNLFAGAIGGLPMIAEIVRSSANVNNGARTGWANFFHGAFLALFVLFFPKLIHQIPLASLASLLVFTGFRLASPKEFAKTMQIGKEQLFIFVVTILAVLATDLLIGVLIGIAVKIAIHLSRGVPLSNLARISFTLKEVEAGTYAVHLEGSAIFANFIGLKSELSEIPAGKTVVFDVRDASYIDHTVMEFIEQFQHDYVDRGGKCTVKGLDELVGYSAHPLAARRRS